MRYRALILDIDGTLVCRERQQPTPQCVAALRQLQKQGIIVIIATGRGPFISTPEMLGGFVPDYRVCVNGSLVLNGKGEILHEERLAPEHLQALTNFAIQGNYRLFFTFDDAYYVYSSQDSDTPREGKRPVHIKDGADGARHQSEMPYGAFCIMPAEGAQRYCQANPGLKMMESMSGAYDICNENIGKSVAIQNILHSHGLTWAEAVAVGDSENDMEMIAAAGLGVAMGNAQPRVKAIANHITQTVDDDGVFHVIQDYFT